MRFLSSRIRAWHCSFCLYSVYSSDSRGSLCSGLAKTFCSRALIFCAVSVRLRLSLYAVSLTTHPDEQSELVIGDVHVLYRVQKGYSIREPSVHLQDTLPQRLPSIERANVLRKVET